MEMEIVGDKILSKSGGNIASIVFASFIVFRLTLKFVFMVAFDVLGFIRQIVLKCQLLD